MSTTSTPVALDYSSLEAIQRIFKLDKYQAAHIIYLRSRRRWSIPLENDLIKRLKAGERVNILEFGCTDETGNRLLDEALEKLDLKLDPGLNKKAHASNLQLLSLKTEELKGQEHER